MRSGSKIEDLLQNYIGVLSLLGNTPDKAAVVRARKITEYGIRWYYMHRLAKDGNDEYSRAVFEKELLHVKQRFESDRTVYEMNYTFYDNHSTIYLRLMNLVPIEFAIMDIYFNELTKGEEDALWDKLNNGDVV
jgi:hypothetical protein